MPERCPSRGIGRRCRIGKAGLSPPLRVVAEVTGLELSGSSSSPEEVHPNCGNQFGQRSGTIDVAGDLDLSQLFGRQVLLRGIDFQRAGD